MRRRTLMGAVLALAGCQSPGAGPARRIDASATLERVVFGSCIDQTEPQPVWQGVLATRPDLMIFGGDNVYASGQPWSRTRLEAAYGQLAADAGFARLRREVPALAIWDDHDYGLNDGGAEFAHKQASKQVFLDFWGAAADDERRRREGLYFARSFGPAGQRVQVILLDTRWFRSPLKPSPRRGTPGQERYVPDPDPGKTMLGDAQWQWLEARLAEPADVRLLVSGIQVIVEGHGFERWGNLPLERERLVAAIARTRAAGVVLLSGDRHIGALYRRAEAAPYPLYELTSSGITHPWTDASEPGPNRLGELVTVVHFGGVRIDWKARRLQLALHDVNGRELQAHRVEFAELQATA